MKLSGKGAACLTASVISLAACAPHSFGTAATGFAFPQTKNAYIALGSSNIFVTRNAAAVVIAPGVAATNAHNSNVVDPASVIGEADGYDLLYFHTARMAALPTAAPFDGETVTAYGQGADGSLRVSTGIVRKFWPAAFGYVADAGPGFSGGPVLDAKTGALVGITYGYIDNANPAGRLMVAYNMAFVGSEYAGLKTALAATSARNNR